MQIDKAIILSSFILISAIYLFGITEVDLSVQDLFYNFTTHQWILPWSQEPYKFIFYDGIKKLLILFAIVLLVMLVSFRRKSFLDGYKKGLLVVVLSAIFVPALSSGLKKYTNMPCPRDEVRYGGVYPRTAVWETYTQEFTLTHKRTKCWPAGHASGGFALMSLFFLFHKKRNRYIALSGAVIIGWAMGGYKMIIGDHFLSHTVITMIFAWLIILIIVRGVYGKTFP